MKIILIISFMILFTVMCSVNLQVHYIHFILFLANGEERCIYIYLILLGEGASFESSVWSVLDRGKILSHAHVITYIYRVSQTD